ncbi:MAG TPA: hypothetical protein VFY68_15895, partial [Nitrososphaeraceae archaeon]|nr:hypothetical protein [Nitrososphaeraceae archaeon]
MTDDRNITFEESLNHIRFIKELIGKDRLSNEFHIIKTREEQIRESSSKVPKFGYDKEFHPLFYLLWKNEKHLEDSVTATDEFTRASSLGEDLLTLINSNTEGLDRKIHDLMSSKHELFDKTTYEIHIAAMHVKRGHSIRFVPTDSKSGKRTADLLVDNQIEVECKKKDHSSKQYVKSIEYWNQMGNKLFGIMEYLGQNYSITISSEKYPTADDVKLVTTFARSLIKNSREGTFSHPKRGIEITLEKLLPLNYGVQTNTIKHRTSEPDYSFFLSEAIFSGQGNVTIQNNKFFAFRTKEHSDKIKGIIGSIRRAIRQLRGVVPNVIYVDLSVVVNTMTERDFELLFQSINDILRNNSRV